jgi:cysteine desulfurase
MDYNATTPVDPRVLEDMLPYFSEKFGNAASKHFHGNLALESVESMRAEIIKLIGDVNEIGKLVFTSGATESNNLVLQSFAKHHMAPVHIITTAIEHKCILSTCRELQSQNINTTIVPVDDQGLVRLDALERALAKHTHSVILVSVMAANNEVGVIQDIKKISELVHKYGGKLHVDAAQALGKYSFGVDDLGVDTLSMSAHKFYGPKGVGALWVRDSTIIRQPIIFGGGQEYGLRSGTLNIPGIVGMSVALHYATYDLDSEVERITRLKKKMWDRFELLEEATLNGHETQRQPGNLNVSFKYVPSSRLISEVSEVVSISAGSACTSASVEPSHVLRAMGLSEEEMNSSVRICLGRYTTEEEVDIASTAIITAVNEIRESSELWRTFKIFQAHNFLK